MNQMVELKLNLPLNRAHAVLSFLNLDPGEPGITKHVVTQTPSFVVADRAAKKNGPLPKLDLGPLLYDSSKPDPERGPGRPPVLNIEGEKALWKLHCDGFNARQISQVLQGKLCPEAVRLIVKRIAKHMPKKDTKRS